MNDSDTPGLPVPPQEASTPMLPMEMPIIFQAPKLGQIITSALTGNTYTICHQIGEGSFSTVYYCVDDWGNELAAKVLKPIGYYETVRERTISEVGKLVHLRHPNITYVYDAFEYQNAFYIVTEHCDYSMSQLLKEDWFNGQVWIMPIARSLLQAVEFLHGHSLVHKDIHPGNVLTKLTRNELDNTRDRATSFRLADLGISNFVESISPGNTLFAKWMLPPECIDKDVFGPINHKIDIYHCGLFFLQLFHSREIIFTEDEILRGAPRQMALQLPQPFRSALEKALRRHSIYRTDSAREMWRDLNSPS